MTDRFRPDAAVRRVVPIQRKPVAITTEEMIGWLDDPRVAGAVRVPGEVAGKRADRVIVDDVRESCPHCGGDCSSANPPVIACPMRSGAALFEDHGPTAGEGRRSFPRSHRGEGRNFVD